MASARSAPSRNAKIVALSCLHSPFTDQSALDWALGEIEKMKGLTHCVLLGDSFESAAASVHPNEYEHQQEDEYEAACGTLRKLDGVLPRGCRRIWTLGNHDDNLTVRDFRRVPKGLRSLVHWNKHAEFGPQFRRWTQLPYVKDSRGVFRVGQACFFHGFDAGSNSDELETLQMIYGLGGFSHGLGGFSHGLGIRGHTHRPRRLTQIMRTPSVPLPYWCMNTGHFGPAKPDWTNRQSTLLWGNALAVVEARCGDPFRMRGQCWSATLLQHQ